MSFVSLNIFLSDVMEYGPERFLYGFGSSVQKLYGFVFFRRYIIFFQSKYLSLRIRILRKMYRSKSLLGFRQNSGAFTWTRFAKQIPHTNRFKNRFAEGNQFWVVPGTIYCYFAYNFRWAKNSTKQKSFHSPLRSF